MVLTISMEGTQKPKYDCQLCKLGKFLLELNLANIFEIKEEARFWRRQKSELMGYHYMIEG